MSSDFDFDAVVAPFRMQPGLRRLGAKRRHLTPVADGDRWLREKLAVLAAWPHEVAVAAPGFDPRPALGALAARATAEHPDAFALDGPHAWRAPRLRWSVLGDGEVVGDGAAEIANVLRALPVQWRAPALLSLAFREDFAVIEADRGRVPWILACLPSNWAPAEKVGRSFTEVHAPVAGNDVLLAAADGLARLVTSGEPWERSVWTITDDPRLQRHPRHTPAPRWDLSLDAKALLDTAWLRTERQTFLPVEGAPQAVFTIAVDVQPVRAVLRRAAHAQRMAEALGSMTDTVLAYKGIDRARDRLVSALLAHAARLTA